MTGILSLQNLYLSETDRSAKEKLLSQLYVELVKLGKYILQIKKFPNSQDDVYDLASDICCRLMEKQIPVIKSAPSAYLASALYFKNKDGFHSSLEEIDEPAGDSFEDSILFSDETKKLQQQLISYATSFTSNPFVLQLVVETITYQMEAKDVKSHIKTPSDKAEYSRAIKKIRQYLKEKTQC